MHAEHEAMRESGYNETHFKYRCCGRPRRSRMTRVTIVSDAFKGKMPVQRHRLVYALLDDEFQKGLHAINIITKTPQEYERGCQ